MRTILCGGNNGRGQKKHGRISGEITRKQIRDSRSMGDGNPLTIGKNEGDLRRKTPRSNRPTGEFKKKGEEKNRSGVRWYNL